MRLDELAQKVGCFPNVLLHHIRCGDVIFLDMRKVYCQFNDSVYAYDFRPTKQEIQDAIKILGTSKRIKWSYLKQASIENRLKKLDCYDIEDGDDRANEYVKKLEQKHRQAEKDDGELIETDD